MKPGQACLWSPPWAAPVPHDPHQFHSHIPMRAPGPRAGHLLRASAAILYKEMTSRSVVGGPRLTPMCGPIHRVAGPPLIVPGVPDKRRKRLLVRLRRRRSRPRRQRCMASGPVCNRISGTQAATCSSPPISATFWANLVSRRSGNPSSEIPGTGVGSLNSRQKRLLRFAIIHVVACGCGEIGRRAGFRFLLSLGSHGKGFDGYRPFPSPVTHRKPLSRRNHYRTTTVRSDRNNLFAFGRGRGVARGSRLCGHLGLPQGSVA